MYDVIVIGSGPAGLTAGIYASRDDLKTLIIGGGRWGGQLMLTGEVENYPGFPNGILGPELMSLMRKQAERFGTEIKLVEATKVDFKTEPFKVWTNELANGRASVGYSSKTVIIATGAETNWLGLPNEQRLIGKGVSSCAPCDAFFFKNKKVMVVGGGDAAMEEVLTLSKFAAEVTIIHRRDSFRASKIMQQKVLGLSNVKIQWNSQIIDVLGSEKVEGVRLASTVDNRQLTVRVDGVFVAIGHSPNTKIFEGQLNLDRKGYILRQGGEIHGVGAEEKIHSHFQMMTSVSGVFVAGDVHDHHFRQAVTAGAYGCMAALEVSRYLQGVNGVVK